MTIIEITRAREYNMTNIEIIRKERHEASQRNHTHFLSSIADYRTGTPNPWRATKSGAMVNPKVVSLKLRKWTKSDKDITTEERKLQKRLETLIGARMGKKVHLEIP